MGSMFISYLTQDPWFYFTWVLIVIFSICVHEFSHAWMALKLGDPTAADRGHLSLNPLVQMGPTSLVVLGLFGIAWGAVPVNVGRLTRRGDAAVSAAGPAANLILAVLAALIATILALPVWGTEGVEKAAQFFRFAALANAVLFLLNMLPVPMLDGWSVFSLFIPVMRTVSAEVAQALTMIFFMVLFMTPAGSLLWVYGGAIAEVLFVGWGQVFSMVLVGFWG